MAGLAALAAALFSHQRFQLRVHPAQIPVVLGLSVAAVAVHEFAHALVVVRHHRTVDGAGLRLHLGTPAFYVESAAALLLPRPHRLIQAAAGVWAEWQFTSIVAIWLWYSPAPGRPRCCTGSCCSTPPPSPPTCSPSPAWTAPGCSPTPCAFPTWPTAARGSLSRLLTAPATRQPRTARRQGTGRLQRPNGLAAAALLATAGFFWYQLFGDLAATLVRYGPAGWLTLAAAAIVLAMPALTAAAPG